MQKDPVLNDPGMGWAGGGICNISVVCTCFYMLLAQRGFRRFDLIPPLFSFPSPEGLEHRDSGAETIAQPGRIS